LAGYIEDGTHKKYHWSLSLFHTSTAIAFFHGVIARENQRRRKALITLEKETTVVARS